MKDKKQNLDFEIVTWFIDWHREDEHYFCAVVRFKERTFYIERKLEQT